MADILSGISDSNQTQLDLLVDAYRKSQQTRVTQLNTKQTDLETRKTFFNSLNSRLNSLVSSLDKLKADDANSNFEKRKVSSSDSSFLTATATLDANLDVMYAKVDRLATKDVLIAEQKTLDDSLGLSAGTYSFDLSNGSNTKSISVNLDGTESYEVAMKKVADAINDVSESKIRASFVKDSSTTGRLSFSSLDTGSDNKITFTDSPLLAKFGLDSTALQSNTNSRVLSSGNSAGYKVANYEDLNSKLTLDNITITRSSNTIDDAIEGMTFTLLKAQESDASELSLKTEVDSDSVKNYIEPILKSINDIMSFVQSNTKIKRNDSAISNLQGQLRNIYSQNLNPSAVGDEPNYLSEIGIKTDSNGNLTISDIDKLKNNLIANATKVAELFTGADGLASKIDNAISPFKGDNGLIKSRTNNLNTQIEQTKKRTEEVNDRIEMQAQSLRKQYMSYMQSLYSAQAQSNLLGTFQVDNSGYNSLLT